MFRMSWKEMQSFGQDEGPESPPREPQRYLGKPAFVLSLTGILERDLNFYLQTMDKSISLAALPPPACLALTNYLAAAGTVVKKSSISFPD